MYSIKYSMPVLLVKNISVSKKFYQDLFSLEIENDFGENIVFKNAFSIWQKNYAEKIIFNSIRKNSFDGTNNLELYFETNEIDEVWEKIEKRSINLIHGLKEESWGQRTIRFYDPDKFIIEIAEPIEYVILRLYKAGLSEKELSKKMQVPLSTVVKIIKNNS